MPCLLVAIGLFMPRVVLFFIWLLTSWTMAFETHIWPLLGWMFMPYTTLCYLCASCATDQQIHGGWAFLIVFGVLLDFGIYGGTSSNKSLILDV